MADDVVLPGTGATVATDEVSSRHYQLVKPAFGADGSATLVSSAAPLPTSTPMVLVTASGSAVGDVISSQDCAGFQTIGVMVSGTYSGSLSLRASVDNSTWVTVACYNDTSGFAAQFDASSTNNTFSTGNKYRYPNLNYRYFKVEFTAYTSGTATVTFTAVPNASGLTPVYLAYANSQTLVRVTAASSFSPADATAGMSCWAYAAFPNFGFNGSTYDRERYPEIFKSATATASGNTTVWTPTSGKRYQLLKVQFFATADATLNTGAVLTVKLQDNTTDIGVSVPVYVPTTGGTALGGWSSGAIDLGKYGKRSSAINTTLNVNISAALTAGSIGVMAFGTEE